LCDFVQRNTVCQNTFVKAPTLALLATFTLLASDQRLLDLALKAQSDFERVELTPRPRIPDAETCLQSQAAALAVSPPEERSLLYYRSGYCAFAVATVTGNDGQFLAAVELFNKAIEAWPERARKGGRRAPPEPVSASLRVFASIARLQGSPQGEGLAAVRREVAAALESPSCFSTLMPAEFCTQVLAGGAQWLGWFALRDDQLDLAARHFSFAPDSGWVEWAQGRREFHDARFAAAAAQYGKAIDQWKRTWWGDGPTFLQALGPRPQYASALADWGGARLLAGDLSGAILTLDAAIQADSTSSHALFLRARAKELAGQKDAALGDYNLASRTAFAGAVDLASGEAHLYRGIVSYRRRDFARAEEEFSSALNFEMMGPLRPDARAWRHLAAVAGGSCGPARESLGQALASISPFFPRDEARSLASLCDAAAAR
jgi:tetratricopeptide (TPR) repeat protein